jgi:hypothetical protein
LQNWSLDRHHKPLNVLRSRISALGRSISLPKEGMSGAAAETRAASLTAEIDDFRNKIGTKPTSRDVGSVGAKGPKADIRPKGQNRRE